jgi:O-antigen/teichoic acid export membrane protein
LRTRISSPAPFLPAMVLSRFRKSAGRAPGARASYREGLLFGTLGVFPLVAVGLVSTVTIARLYGIGVVGQFALAVAPAGTIAYLSTVREQVALVRALSLLEPRAPRVTGLFVAIFVFSASLTVLVAGSGTVVSYFLFRGPIHHPELFAPALVYTTGWVVLMNTCWNIDAVLAGFRAGRQLSWIRLHQAASFLALAVAGGMVSRSVWSLVFAMIGSWATALVHRLWSVRGFMTGGVSRADIRAGFQALPQMVAFGVKIAPGAIAAGIRQQVGIWVLGGIGSIAAIGAYNRAWMLGSRFVDLATRVTEMLFPTLVARRADGDEAGFDRALVDSLRYSAAGMLLLAAVGGGAAYGIMDLLGPGFSAGANALALLLAMPALITMAAVQRHALLAVNRPLAGSTTAIGSLAVTAAASLPLTASMGVTGTALALLLGVAADVVLVSWPMRARLLHALRELWPPQQMLALVFAYASGFLLARLANAAFPGALGLCAGLGLGTAAYVAAFLLAGGVNGRDRTRAAAILDGLQQRRADARAARPTPRGVSAR